MTVLSAVRVGWKNNRWLRLACVALPVGYLFYAQRQLPTPQAQHVRLIAPAGTPKDLHLDYRVAGASVREATLAAPVSSATSQPDAEPFVFDHRPSMPNGHYDIGAQLDGCTAEAFEVDLQAGTHTLRLGVCQPLK
jgi:hypothetical protein